MAYVGKVPWHGLGVNLGDELVDSETMFKAAQQDFQVLRKPQFIEFDGELVNTGQIALVNGDNKAILGHATDEWYTDFQNHELYEVLDGALGSNRMYETAGVLKQGKVVFTSIRLAADKGVTRLDGTEDRVDDFLLASTGHDGRTALILTPTRIRVVCWNTWSYATATCQGKENFFWIAHNQAMPKRIEEAKAAIDRTYALGVQQREWEQQLAKQKMSGTQFRNFAEKVMLDVSGSIKKAKEALTPRALKNHEKRIETCEQLFTDGAGNTGETQWDGLNAITEFIDHHKQVYQKSVDAQRAARFSQATFGEGEKRKRRAQKLLLAKS
jgi:phage/plasmid-like protein (TIGR03299 family)